jgi:DNA-binding transcriptional LysR family regulator
MSDLNQIRFFASVAKAASFTGAAHELALPKSTISRAVARLENRLGVRLLNRTTRRVLLTEAGEAYLRHATRALDEAEQADLAVSALAAEPHGRLRVSLPTFFAQSAFLPVMVDLVARYPRLQIQLELRVAAASAPVTAFDISIQSGPVEDSELMIQKLGRSYGGLYASREYIERHGTPKSVRDLKQHSCLTQSGASGDAWHLHRGARTVEIRTEPRVSGADLMLQYRLATAGIGIANLPHFLAAPDGSLVRVLPGWDDSVELFAIYPSKRASSVNVRVCLDFLSIAAKRIK